VETAVVTGAGRGLGRAIAARLADRGYAVVVGDVDAELAERAAHGIGRDAVAARADVRDSGALRSLAERATERGRLAVWVNNAGVLRTGKAWEQDDETVELMTATNLMGVVHGSRAAVEAMRADGDGDGGGGGGGRILNVASLAALAPAAGYAVYSATKYGVLAFSLALQAELREAGAQIEVRTLCPDGIATDMLRERVHEPDAAMSWSGARLQSAEEVAERGIELLYGERLVGVVPPWRGVLARTLALTPRLGIRLTPALRRLGERNRRRWREADG
jgi:short-subunit dehydrogenase